MSIKENFLIKIVMKAQVNEMTLRNQYSRSLLLGNTI